MVIFQTRGRRWLGVAIAVTLFASLTAMLLKPKLERAVRQRIESAAARHGMVARIASVRVGISPLLRLTGVDLDLGHGMRLHAETIGATYPGRLRLALSAANLVGPSDLRVNLPATAWYAAGIRSEDLELTLIEPQEGLTIRQQTDSAGSGWIVKARNLDISRLLDLRRAGHPLVQGGIADGRVDLRSSADALQFDVVLVAACQFYYVSPISRYVHAPTVLYLQEPARRLYEARPTPPWIAPPPQLAKTRSRDRE